MSERLVDVVVPAHNEAPTLGATLREFHARVTAGGRFTVRFVVCEDGSTDDTVAVLRALADELPLHIITGPERKGYSRAVLDGIAAATAPWVAFIDADGQCDPGDFERLFALLDRADVAVGYRAPRVDPWARRAMSQAFGAVYRALFPVRLRDPSCPFVILRREHLPRLLRGTPGLLEQGFWWEFMARAAAAGLTVAEAPIHHRSRADGTTRVYLPSKLPGIAWRHLGALVTLRRELSALGGGGPEARRGGA